MCALAAPVGVVFADHLLRQRKWPLPLTALMDETAHLATAQLLVIAATAGHCQVFSLGTLLGAILLDADHLPRRLRPQRSPKYAGRPVPHSLATLAGLGVATALLTGPSRQLALGAACGLATHLIRDAATGGVPLGWPLTSRRITLPYEVYLGMLLGAAVEPARRLAEWRTSQDSE
jgi:inner membrane protein